MQRMGMMGLIVLALTLSGCFNWLSKSKPPEKQASATSRTQSTGKTAASASPGVAEQVDNRGLSTPLVKRLRAAITLDAHPQGWEMVLAVADCTPATCPSVLKKVGEISKACLLGGHVALLIRAEDFETAEEKLEVVEEIAAKEGPTRAAALKHNNAVKAANAECEDTPDVCKKRCDEASDLPSCIAHGVHLYATKKKYDEGRAYLKKGCDADYQIACKLIEGANEAEEEETRLQAAQVESAWEQLQMIGDDLATKKYLHSFAQQHAKGPRNARATQNMATHIAAITKESYCPTVKEFLAVSTRAELAKRAKAHCDESPPTATGLSGAEVVLTSQCNTVYAITCP